MLAAPLQKAREGCPAFSFAEVLVPQWRWNGGRCSSTLVVGGDTTSRHLLGRFPRHPGGGYSLSTSEAAAFRTREDRLLLVASVAATRNLSRGLSHGGSPHRLHGTKPKTHEPRIGPLIARGSRRHCVASDPSGILMSDQETHKRRESRARDGENRWHEG